MEQQNDLIIPKNIKRRLIAALISDSSLTARIQSLKHQHFLPAHTS